jgi:lipopolysaccharide/colanic/teichoic acid biosynthesis glycosyltransferase
MPLDDNGRRPIHRAKCEFYSEATFRSALYWERQRSERSGKPIVLALATFERSIPGNIPLKNAAYEAVPSLVRATDSVGWFKQNETFGVIFTELGPRVDNSLLDIIAAKLKLVLGAAFPPEIANNVCLSYHVFPDCNSSLEEETVFYPDVATGAGKVASAVKRAIDMTGSLLALVVLSPLLLMIAVAIKFTSDGPIWYRQTRIGQKGKTFTVLKFRSMYHGANPSRHRDYVIQMINGENVSEVHCENKVYKIVNDPRVTFVGRMIRRSSLDELPQFINVLRGDMSLVGPRPPLVYEFECYQSWHRRRVLEVKPGITGLWQVNGRSRTTFDEMVRLDLQYVRTWSLWLDLKILLTTPRAVISGSGAY